jgi:hypothetical protein
MNYDEPPGYGPEQLPPPDVADNRVIRDRVQLPAIFLIIVGVVNLLLGFAAIGVGFFYSAIPPDKAEQVLMQRDPAQVQAMKNMGMRMQDILNLYVYGGYTEGVFGLLTCVLTIVGGARMLVLKSYVLAVFASVVAAIPCISCSACCGLGEGIGIWALVVLLNNDVRAAFR